MFVSPNFSIAHSKSIKSSIIFLKDSYFLNNRSFLYMTGQTAVVSHYVVVSIFENLLGSFYELEEMIRVWSRIISQQL